MHRSNGMLSFFAGHIMPHPQASAEMFDAFELVIIKVGCRIGDLAKLELAWSAQRTLP